MIDKIKDKVGGVGGGRRNKAGSGGSGRWKKKALLFACSLGKFIYSCC